MKKQFYFITLIFALTIILPLNVWAVDTNNSNNNNNYTIVNQPNNSNSNTNNNTNSNTNNNSNKNTNKNTNSNTQNPSIDMSGYNQNQNCNTLLGNPKDSNSVAWLIDKILTYATIAGMALVVVLSSFDFLKVIVKSDDDEMTKATKKLFMRLLLAGLLFFVPTLTNTLLGLFGLTSDATCGIQQG